MNWEIVSVRKEFAFVLWTIKWELYDITFSIILATVIGLLVQIKRLLLLSSFTVVVMVISPVHRCSQRMCHPWRASKGGLSYQRYCNQFLIVQVIVDSGYFVWMNYIKCKNTLVHFCKQLAVKLMELQKGIAFHFAHFSQNILIYHWFMMDRVLLVGLETIFSLVGFFLKQYSA